MNEENERMMEVQRKYEDFLSRVLKVTYVAVGPKMKDGKPTGQLSLRIGVERKLFPMDLMPEDAFWVAFEDFRKNGVEPRPVNAAFLAMIPNVLDGFQTDVFAMPMIKIPLPGAEAMKSGDMKPGDTPIPMGTPEEHQGKFRPTPAGVSYIACGSSACSLGATVRGRPDHPFHKNCKGKPHYGTVTYKGKNYTGCWHRLTNYHCIMNFANGEAYPTGHGCVQPSPYDQGVCPDDVIGTVSENVIPVKPLGFYNNFDGSMQDVTDLSNVIPEIKDMGEARNLRFTPRVGDLAASSSRTMGTTFGNVIATEVTITVNYIFFMATIKHCIQHSARIAGGSSGSAFMTRESDGDEWAFTGLNFAGSDLPDQNYACHGGFITDEYGVDVDWVVHPDEGEPPVPPPECPEGQYWDEKLQKCVDYPPEPPPEDPGCLIKFIDCITKKSGDPLGQLFCIVDFVVCAIKNGLTMKQIGVQVLALLKKEVSAQARARIRMLEAVLKSK